MNDETDPLNGTFEEREAYVQNIFDMIDQDIEQRRAQRYAEFQRNRTSKAVLEGGLGSEDAVIRAVGDSEDA